MHCDPLDFNKILKAIENTYGELQTEELSNAKQTCIDAIAYAASTEPEYIKYGFK